MPLRKRFCDVFEILTCPNTSLKVAVLALKSHCPCELMVQSVM